MGYRFAYVPGKVQDGYVATYTVQADPLKPGVTGRMHFSTDESGVIREEMDKPASAESPPLMP